MPEQHTMIYNTIGTEEIRKCSFLIQEPSGFDTLENKEIFLTQGFMLRYPACVSYSDRNDLIPLYSGISARCTFFILFTS